MTHPNDLLKWHAKIGLLKWQTQMIYCDEILIWLVKMTYCNDLLKSQTKITCLDDIPKWLAKILYQNNFSGSHTKMNCQDDIPKWLKIPPSYVPHDLCMLKFMITFALCSTLDKSPSVGHILKMWGSYAPIWDFTLHI
jgi:hypothetical protein